jgi:fused signal recognition particle receptor
MCGFLINIFFKYSFLFYIIGFFIVIFFILIFFLRKNNNKNKSNIKNLTLSSKNKSIFTYIKNKKNKSSFTKDFEKILYNADFSSKVVSEIINKLENVKDYDVLEKDLKKVLLKEAKSCEADLNIDKKPYIILVVGVNGVGKTTLAGRLAYYFAKQDKKIMLIGADTFRAAAVEQLKVWSEKTSSLFFSKGSNTDMGANVYEGLKLALEEKTDIVIIDTGGRIHTKENLMNELGKLDRVIKKLISDAPHLNLLVLDANTGQNLISQAKVFSKHINISGLALTKFDGSAKGGAILKISKDLALPVYFLGMGEKKDDLLKFDAENFVNKII